MGMEIKKENTGAQISKAAGAMSIATFLSRIMGLVREQTFAFFFGASHATDAFQIAFRIPNLLRDLFAEGAMSSTLVPTFTEVREKEGPNRAWYLAGLVFRVLFILVSILTLVGIFFAEEIVSLYASSFKDTPGKFEMTVLLTQILFPFFPLVALAAAYMGILNACGRFFWPAFASALFNVGSVITGVVFIFIFRWQNIEPIYGMALGVVLGGAVQAFCQLPVLYKVGYQFPSKNEREQFLQPWYQNKGLRQMMVMMIPGTIGMAATQVNVLVNSVLATSQGAGAVSWLNYAFRLMQFPIGVFGVSIAAATLPVVSRQIASHRIEDVSDTLLSSLKKVIAVNFPATVFLIVLGEPIIRLLFEYGRFTSMDTQSTAQALAFYAIGLTSYSIVKVLVPICYAFKNTKIPVISSFLSICFVIGSNLVLVQSMGFVGLALGTSIAAFMNACFLFWAIRREFRIRSQVLKLMQLLNATMGQLLLALWMALIVFVADKIFIEYFNPNLLLNRLLELFIGFVAGVLSLYFGAKLFKIQDTLNVFQWMIEKFVRFKKRAL